MFLYHWRNCIRLLRFQEHTNDHRNHLHRRTYKHSICTICSPDWHFIKQNHVLQPLDQVAIPMKVRDFRAFGQAIQVFLSILQSCMTLSEANQHLRTEVALANIWKWNRFADQSSLSCTFFDVLTQTNLTQLRHSMTVICEPRSQTRRHDWRGYLWLDFDLTGLPCSARAEASPKRLFCRQKNVSGRQLVRASAIEYRETIWSKLFPGNRHTVQCFQPAVSGGRKCFRVNASAVQADSMAYGWWFRERRAAVLAAESWLPCRGQGSLKSPRQALARRVER